MTPHEFRTIRTGSGLSQGQAAALLGLGKGGNVNVSRWEAGVHRIPGTVALVMRLLSQGRLADEVAALA